MPGWLAENAPATVQELVSRQGSKLAAAVAGTVAVGIAAAAGTGSDPVTCTRRWLQCTPCSAAVGYRGRMVVGAVVVVTQASPEPEDIAEGTRRAVGAGSVVRGRSVGAAGCPEGGWTVPGPCPVKYQRRWCRRGWASRGRWSC